MDFTSPPELMTALTDLLDAAAAAAFLILSRKDKGDVPRMWRILMTALMIGGALGFFVHLVNWSAEFDRVMWVIIPLFMCIAVAVFAALGMCEILPEKRKTIYILMAALCVISYTAVIILSFVRDNFLTPFTIFAAVCIATSGVMFIISYTKTKKPHLIYYIIGVFIEVPGGIVQAKRDLYFTLIFKMDFNSVYHFILFISIILFIIGYKKERRHCPRS